MQTGFKRNLDFKRPLPSSILTIARQDDSWELFPNPTNSIITIRTASSGNHSVKISNMYGETIVDSVFSDNFSFDFSNYATGIFIGQITDESNKISTCKIVYVK